MLLSIKGSTLMHTYDVYDLSCKQRGCEEMNPHFFTAPFYFAFIWFRVQGSGGGFAAFFLEDGILVSQPSPLGNAIKLRKSLAT